MKEHIEYCENSFICEWCGTLIIDSPEGYRSECEHYRIPEEFKVTSTFFKFPPIEVILKDEEKSS
jgi:hypothetical protein